MSDYLHRLEVPAYRLSFTVAEALDATSSTYNPDSDAEGPVMILSIEKVAHSPLSKPLAGRPTGLTDEDWQALRGIWAGMPEPEFPMPLEQWQPYCDAFNSSPDKHEGWDLMVLQRDPAFQNSLMRGITLSEHRESLKRAVDSGAISLRNPKTGVPSALGWVGDAEAQSWLLTRAHLKAFCDLLAIELIDGPRHFVTSARPLEVPAELLALSDDARVSYEHNIARQRGSGITNAASYRESIQDTMARQAAGHFTLNEAAQVLADSRPGLDPMETVRRFRLAHSKGELPIHQGGSGFRLEMGETVRDFLDTLEVGELDAWLRTSVGYGFPQVEGTSLPAPAVRASVTQEHAPDRGRKVKRAALIADNVRRWPTIERDLKDAATNGLSEAAKDGAVGWWWEGSAVEWARARAKVQDIAPGLASVTSTIHRMRG